MQRWQEVSSQVAKEFQEGDIQPLFRDASTLHVLESH